MLRTIGLASFGLVASSLLFAQFGHAGADGVTAVRRPGALAVLPATELASGGNLSGCTDRLLSSPVLMYTSAGGTLLGLELDQITVYSTGLVLVASADSHSGGMSARMAMVPAGEVLRLARALGQVGAFEACDQSYDATDVPLKTVSLARSTGTDVQLHSFSYWLATDQFGVIESALEQWLLDNGIVGSSRE